MNCPSCGAQVNDGFDFCTYCGNTLPKNYEYVPSYEDVNLQVNDMNVDKYVSGVKPGFILGIVSLATGVANFTLAGIICGIISLIKLHGLPPVSEEYITDPIKLSEYRSALKKAKLSKKLSIAGIVVGVVTELILWIAGIIIAIAPSAIYAAIVFVLAALEGDLF